ncbi:hypothetical protein HMI54_014517 [Coelomomyces lativittatus]|nr:hypothetical protein HMI56_003667 [Coelomomyces lativittatus]KAJ1514087.1 hypothetical protein HMI54_014517 [Coelomomyces lativittatus]KAJ1514211.1 hypothetical protein HMI55_004869 [Coelomomyces lativittatus]
MTIFSSSDTSWVGWLTSPSLLRKDLRESLVSICPPEAPPFLTSSSPGSFSTFTKVNSLSFSKLLPPLASRHFLEYLSTSSFSNLSFSSTSSPLPSFCECSPLPEFRVSYLVFSFSPVFSSFHSIVKNSSGLFLLPIELWAYMCQRYFTPTEVKCLSEVCRYLRTLLYPFRSSTYYTVTSPLLPPHVSRIKLPKTFFVHPHWIHLVSISMRHVDGASWGLHLLSHVAPFLMDVDVAYTPISDKDVAAFLRSRPFSMGSMICTGCPLVEGHGFLTSAKPVTRVYLDLTSVEYHLIQALITQQKVSWLDIQCTPYIEDEQAKELERLGQIHHVFVITSKKQLNLKH